MVTGTHYHGGGVDSDTMYFVDRRQWNGNALLHLQSVTEHFHVDSYIHANGSKKGNGLLRFHGRSGYANALQWKFFLYVHFLPRIAQLGRHAIDLTLNSVYGALRLTPCSLLMVEHFGVNASLRRQLSSKKLINVYQSSRRAIRS